MTKNERINEIDVGAILEAAQEQLYDIREQQSKMQEQLITTIEQQLNNAKLEFLRHDHNIGVVIDNLETAIIKLMEGR